VFSVACTGSDEAATSLRLAVRAPSVHNCQPWRWVVGPTQPLEADDTREFIRSRAATAHSAHPQILPRIG
jgi:nitroreductase